MNIPFVGSFSETLDDFLRFQDLDWRRTSGGILDRWFGIDRYSPGVVILPALLSWALVMGGPGWAPRTALGLMTAVAVAALILFFTRLSVKRDWPVWVDFVVQTGLLGIVGGAVWVFGPDYYQDWPYKDGIIVLAGTTALALITGLAVTQRLVPPLHATYATCLRDTELFRHREKMPPITILDGIESAAKIVKSKLLYLAWPPAFAALLAPPDNLSSQLPPALLALGVLPNDFAFWLPVAVALLFALVFLWLGGLNPRFDTMWRLLEGAFFRGGALPVSLVVIALGAGRAAGISYVTTVFYTPERFVLTGALMILYVLAWWYDYWMNRLLTQRVLRLIDPNVGTHPVTEYPFDPPAEKPRTSVPADGRRLQIHGSSRFLAIHDWPGHPNPLFQAHTTTELLAQLAASGGAQPPWPEMRTRIYLYHGIIGVLALLLPFLLTIHYVRGVQYAEAAPKSEAGGHVVLASLLFNENTCSEAHRGRPLILFAASGGGTRAAIYTASLLEALHRDGRLADVVFGSGVSGGGAALAYFAGHRPALLANSGDSWNEYLKAMKAHYIIDVLDRLATWRMITGTRLGIFLADSFRDRWNLPPDRRQLGQIDDFALLLNTTLTGSLDRADVPEANGALIDLERQNRRKTRSELAGARLVLTNLLLSKDFAAGIPEPRGHHRPPVTISYPGTYLWEAAALNANFPPLFPDAAVDTAEATRYWVTDGGAADNRGLEMLLSAVREAVTPPVPPKIPVPCANPPRLIVVAADAGAFSNAFRQNQGVGGALGAGSQFASELSGELLRQIDTLYPRKGQTAGLDLVYLPLPLQLAKRWGTHWMLQDSITVQPEGSGKPKTLTGDQMIAVVRAMHAPNAQQVDQDVLEWMRQDCWHRSGWEGLQAAFRGDKPNACTDPLPAP